MINIKDIMLRLTSERPIFHSEADFQHALAWTLHEVWHAAKIRLEVSSGHFDKRERIDILVALEGSRYAFELKYKKRKVEHKYAGEHFALSNDSAQDAGRYDFIKDLVRLERYVFAAHNNFGCALLLTNDDLYWRPNSRGKNSEAFFLHEGRELDGRLAWHERAGEGSIRGRTDALQLRGRYL